jgi:hypothetical protein
MSSPGEIAKKINSGEGVTELTALRTAGKDDDIITVVKALQPPGIFSNKPLWVELSMVLQYSKPMTKLAVIEMMNTHIPRGSQTNSSNEATYEPALVAFNHVFAALDSAPQASDPNAFRVTVASFTMNRSSNIFYVRPLLAGAAKLVEHVRLAQTYSDKTFYDKMLAVMSNMVANEESSAVLRAIPGVESVVSPMLTNDKPVNRVFGMVYALSSSQWCGLMLCVHCRYSHGSKPVWAH